MSRRLVGISTSLALALSGLALLSSPPASAAAPTDAELATALGAPAGVSVTAPSDPLSSAVTNVAFNDFPSAGGSHVLLSTGKASDVFSPNVPNSQPSTDLGAAGPDVTTLTLSVDASASARCLLVDFAMGTEERVHTYIPETASDHLSVTRVGDATEWAVNAGGAYITQEKMNRDTVPAPTSYEVNRIDYWHSPGDTKDPFHGTAESPRLPAISAIDSFTTRDTAEVPLPAGEASTVRVSVADVGNGRLDSVAQVDRVRFAPSCSFGGESMVPDTGVATGEGRIDGNRGVGNVLTLDPVASTPAIEKYDASSNGWFPEPVELRFRWYRQTTLGSTNCYSTELTRWTAVSDGDRQSYVPTNLDKDRCLMVLVTGVKDGYRDETFPTAASGWYVTLPIQDGVFSGQPPTIGCASTPKVGDELSANVVDFVPRPDSYAYQWFAGTSPISGATGQKLVLSADQAGKMITVRVTGKRSGFDDRSETSAGCGPVATLTMTTTPRPIITGGGAPGDELGVDPGVWAPASPTFAYQWRLDGSNISGATRSTYTPKSSDVGRQVTVAVTGAKTGFTPVTQYSDPLTVGLGRLSSAPPSIAGTPVVGGKLTGTASGWTPGATLTYLWSAGGQLLEAGPSRTFTIPPAAAGLPVVLTVRGTMAGYEQVDRASAPTGAVALATIKASTPRIIGTAKVGKTLHVSAAGWSPGTVRKTYRWMVNGKYVGRATTKTSLKIRKAWKGKRISVRVTGVAPGYATIYKTSAKSAKVKKK